jgi:hypothetical protein
VGSEGKVGERRREERGEADMLLLIYFILFLL